MNSNKIDPKLRELARQFGLEWRGDCAARLRDHAISRVREWSAAMAIESAGTLLQIVASLLSVKVLFIHDNEDLRRHAEEYSESWPTLGGQLRDEFINRDTMGLLLAHPAPERGAHRHVAFVDARGDRAVRAYFTAWHEIAHLLLQPPQLAFSGFRRVSVGETKDPLEALVDQVAGELAFYEPFVRPELERELVQSGRLTLAGIDRVGSEVAPEASFSATAHALVRMMDQPMAFLVAEMRLKPSEARRITSDQLTFIAGPNPQEKLRIASAFPNDVAKSAGFKIFQHMRVPQDSVIADVYNEAVVGTVTRYEDQGVWESGGRHLPRLGIEVEARRFGSVVYALISCS